MLCADRSSPRGDWLCGSLVGWTTGPGRLARLFEASWVELIAAPLKSDKPSAPPRPRPCLLLEREDLAGRILEETLYAPGHPPRAPAEVEKHEAQTRYFREKGNPDRAAERTCS